MSTDSRDRERIARGERRSFAADVRASLAFVLAGVASCAASPTVESSSARELIHDPCPEAQAAVRAAVLEISEHVGRNDFDALRADHLESPKFTKFGPRVMRRQDFEGMIADEIAAVSAARDLSIDFRELEIGVFGDVAVATCYPRFTSRDANGEPLQREARMTLVYVRTPDGWKIAHEHSSPYTP